MICPSDTWWLRVKDATAAVVIVVVLGVQVTARAAWGLIR